MNKLYRTIPLFIFQILKLSIYCMHLAKSDFIFKSGNIQNGTESIKKINRPSNKFNGAIVLCLALSAMSFDLHAQTYPNNTGAKAYPNNPFVLNGDHYVSESRIGGAFINRLVKVIRDTDTYTTMQIGPTTSVADGGYPNDFEYNSLGFNPLDNYMYAVVIVSPDNASLTFLANDVIRIDGEGIATKIGRINLATIVISGGRRVSNITGATFLEDGTFVVINRVQGVSSRVIRLDIANIPASGIVPVLSNSAIANHSGGQSFVTDVFVATNDSPPNKVYSIAGNRVIGINASTGAILNEFTVTGVAMGNSGAQWVDSFGNIYTRQCNTGNELKINMDPFNGTVGESQILNDIGDSAPCDGVSGAFTVEMEKTVSPTTAVEGDTVTYTYRISNPNNVALSGLTFTDNMADARAFNAGTLSTNLGGTENAYAGTNLLQITNFTLPADTISTITVDVTIGAGLAGQIFNQATITGLDTAYMNAGRPGHIDTMESDFPDTKAYGDPTPLTVIPPPLSVTKTSSANGSPVSPGETITYTIEVESNATATNIVVSDVLPAGVTYVAQSTEATGPVETTAPGSYLDQFPTRAYNNSNGLTLWTDSWIEFEDVAGGSATQGDIQVNTNGTLRLQDMDTNTNPDRNITRAVDLSIADPSQPVVFSWTADEINGNESIRAELLVNGVWVEVDDTSGDSTESHTLTSAQVAGTTAVRFRSDSGDWSDSERYDIDDVQFTFTAITTTTTTLDNISGGANGDLDNGIPPNLVTSNDGFQLAPGETVTVTFDVTVDADVADGADLTNTATVNVDELTNPLEATVTDTAERTDSVTQFTDSNGNPVDSYDVAGGETTAYLQITDADNNVDPNVVESITVTVTDSITGDSITVTLFETGPSTGVFALDAPGGNRLGIPLDDSCVLPPDPDPDTLCVNSVIPSQLTVTYVDNNDPNDDTSEDTVTNPVTLSYFNVTQSDNGQLHFSWSTSTETANLGFHLYAELGDQTRRLNPGLIPSHVVDTVTPQHYDYHSDAMDTHLFWLSDVDTQGKETWHGPYELDQSYGRSTEADPIDWVAISAEHNAKQGQRKMTLKRNQLNMTRKRNQLNGDQFKLSVEQDGIYRVTHEQLLAEGYDWSGVKGRHIALFNQGVSVPITVHITDNGRKFGPGSYVEFIGESIDSLYSKHNVYVLAIDKAATKRAKAIDAEPAMGVTPESYYLATTEVAEQNEYSFAAPNNDPWFIDRLSAISGPVSRNYSLSVDNLVTGAAASTLEVELWGVTDFPESPDHHVVVEFNAVEIVDRQFDGLTNHLVSASLTDGVLQNGANTLTIHLPHDTAALYDLVSLEGYRITYPRAFVATNGSLSFTAKGKVFAVTGLPSADILVYQRRKNGKLKRLENAVIETNGNDYQIRFAGHKKSATYHVVAESALLTPTLEPVLAEPIEVTNARYQIIAHPDFIGNDLNQLVTAREAEGYSVQVVDVEAVYATYSYHITDPLAIQAYLRDAYSMGAEYVLLVGGDTYDYHDYLGQSALSFIPSLYAQTDALVRYAPVDALYTDVNGDDIPDMAIGRFPVRSTAELATMVDQTLNYGSNGYTRTAVFAADAYDQAQGYDFAHDSDRIIARLPFDWQVERAYVDELGVSGAKSTLLDSINNGVALTGFFGHSGPTVWTFSGLLNSNDVTALTNNGKPTVVTQWGCWNTYYVSPEANTLGHNFMLSGDRGAAAVLGASTLTEAAAEEELAQLLFDQLLKPGMTLGEAIRVAKENYAIDKPEQLDVILGWTLLGDPTLVIEP